MSRLSTPDRILWRIHLRSDPAKVYRMLDTAERRCSFWAESAEETDGVIEFRFVGRRIRGSIGKCQVKRPRSPTQGTKAAGPTHSRFTMNPNKASLLVPTLLIVLGIGWLLTALDVAPRIDWVWTVGLAGVGLLALALGGINKVTVVVAPFFIVASCMSVLRQGGWMPVDVEVPVLTILAGVLLLVARWGAIPVPDWVLEEDAAGGETRQQH